MAAAYESRSAEVIWDQPEVVASLNWKERRAVSGAAPLDVAEDGVEIDVEEDEDGVEGLSSTGRSIGVRGADAAPPDPVVAGVAGMPEEPPCDDPSVP
jgi:hypothetical protein